ncbi:hypothetical protein GW17_00052421 [Ensete ventricosum]|nr:hypothetical protein GW17_00052421 [Ensete ventricosum]
MRLGTCQECVESSPRVSGACQDGARKFARRRLRLTERLSGVAEKLVGSIRNIARNTPGDRQRKTVRLAVEEAGDCRFTGYHTLGASQDVANIKGQDRRRGYVGRPHPGEDFVQDLLPDHKEEPEVRSRADLTDPSRASYLLSLPRPHPPSAGVDQDDAGYYTTQSTIGTPVSAPATGAQIVQLDMLTHQEDPLPPDVPMLRDSASLPRSGWEPKKP